MLAQHVSKCHLNRECFRKTSLGGAIRGAPMQGEDNIGSPIREEKEFHLINEVLGPTDEIYRWALAIG